jgi:predicted small metal-binding protein
VKVLRCYDAGFDCDAEFRGQSEQEVMDQAAEHAQKAHGLQVTPELAKQISSLIRDEKSPQRSRRTV